MYICICSRHWSAARSWGSDAEWPIADIACYTARHRDDTRREPLSARSPRGAAAFIARPFTAQLSPKWHVSAGKRGLGIYSHSVSRLRQKRLVPLLRPISRDKMQIGAHSARSGRFLDRSKSDRAVSLGDVSVRDRYAAVKTNSISGSRGFARCALETRRISNPLGAEGALCFFLIPSCARSSLHFTYSYRFLPSRSGNNKYEKKKPSQTRQFQLVLPVS